MCDCDALKSMNSANVSMKPAKQFYMRNNKIKITEILGFFILILRLEINTYSIWKALMYFVVHIPKFNASNLLICYKNDSFTLW